MNPPDPRATLGPLAQRDGEPVFDEPWQAQLLGLASVLMEQGQFTNKQWSETLGANLRASTQSGAPDTTATYYDAVLATLEHLTTSSGALSPADIKDRRAAWRQAYLDTPHGKPVEL